MNDSQYVRQQRRTRSARTRPQPPYVPVSRPGGPHELGQNWLADHRFPAEMAEILRHAPPQEVLELGAGNGAITRALVAAGFRVTALEIDPRCAARLRRTFAGQAAIVEADVPRPSVDGGILLVRRRAVPLVRASERRSYQDLVRVAFTGSGRGLPGILHGHLPQRAIRDWMAAAAIGPRALPRDVPARQWASLHESLRESLPDRRRRPAGRSPTEG